MKSRFVNLSCLCLLQCTMAVAADYGTNVTPDEAWQRLKEGNARFAADQLAKSNLGTERRQELTTGQRPFAVVLTCADSRVPPELVFNQGLGELFVLRVAGNISEPFVVGSIEYAISQLGAPLIVVLGHGDCGAVQAALGSERPTGDLGELIDQIQVGTNLPTDAGAALAAATTHNVHSQRLRLVESSDIVNRAVQQNQVRIVSGIYNLDSGQVNWLDDEATPVVSDRSEPSLLPPVLPNE